MTSHKKRVARYVLLALTGATLLGIAEATQYQLGSTNAGNPLEWIRAFAATMPSWYVLAALVPLIIQVAKRFPLDSLKTFKSIAVHVCAAITFAIVHLALSNYLTNALFFHATRDAFGANLWRQLSLYFVSESLQYCGIVAVYFAWEYGRRYREKERAASELALKASRLEASLTRANLEALRMQLNPHFLFNTLNTVSVLALKGERQRVARMVSRLSDLLRLSLENDRQTLSLREELDFLERYLEIEQVRFKDRLTVHVDVEEAAYEAEVPSLLLQPIVENAVKYGVSQTIGPGSVSIGCRVRSGMLEVEVSDTGPGVPESRVSTPGTGVGLGNTRARLEQLFGGNYTLDLTNRPGGGALVCIRFPYRRVTTEPHERMLVRQA